MSELELIGIGFKVMLPIIISVITLSIFIWKLCSKISELILTLREVIKQNEIQDTRIEELYKLIAEMKEWHNGLSEKIGEHDIRIKYLEDGKH